MKEINEEMWNKLVKRVYNQTAQLTQLQTQMEGVMGTLLAIEKKVNQIELDITPKSAREEVKAKQSNLGKVIKGDIGTLEDIDIA